MLTDEDLARARQTGKLSLAGCDLKYVPDGVWELTGLRELDLDRNKLEILPHDIGRLTNLRDLGLSHNRLSLLPAEIGLLQNLRMMRLTGNRLKSLPPEIGLLAMLQNLWLDDNELTSLPSQIGQLAGLRRLWLDESDLTSLPAEIGQLTRLRTLRLSGNKLTSLPAQIAGLTDLEELYLGRNKLTVLPPEIGQLGHLLELSLDRNEIAELPDEIGQLGRLRDLDLENNQLAGLPAKLAEVIGKGLSLHLDGNPLQDPLPLLIRLGSDSLAAYVRSLGDAIPQYEAKVVLVGEADVGKTSLVAALLGEPFEQHRAVTHGIMIRPLQLTWRDPESTELTMVIRTWDFGGEELYRVMHQFFFSPRALYLVVWNSRRGPRVSQVEDWVRHIHIRVGDEARVLIVATHADVFPPVLDYHNLQRVPGGMLAGHCEVDSKTGKGIESLKEVIAAQVAQLPQMGQLVSRRWIAARDEIMLLAKSEAQIPFERFSGICENNGLVGDEVLGLAELLNILGQIVYYSDDDGMRDVVILDPEWLTKAISRVLEDDQTTEMLGVLEHVRLRQIWRYLSETASEADNYYPYFLRLMEKFDISYRIDDRTSLVAQLLPHERPQLPWDAMISLPAETRSVVLICKLDEPLPGLVPLLIVRQHRASTGLHWRNGAFLRHEIPAYKSEALLELLSDRELSIEVRAPSPDLFINVLRETVDTLISRRWPGLGYGFYIPCPLSHDATVRCPGQFKLQTMQNLRQGEDPRYLCQECEKYYDVAALLTGFGQVSEHPGRDMERVREAIENLGVQMTHEFAQARNQAAGIADVVRRLLIIVTLEVIDCPRLITITPADRKWTQLSRITKHRFVLTLWCEHPGAWPPCPAAHYEIDKPKDWVMTVAPYANLVVKLFKIAAPLASISAEFLDDRQLRVLKDRLELIDALVDDLPDEWMPGESESPAKPEVEGLTAAEGSGLRALRALLFERDKPRYFGGMRRVTAPSGNLLWVCPEHYPEYNPGLPVIPAR